MVRAHPTVPILTPLNCRFNSNCFQAAATSVLWRAAHPCLRIWIPSPTILPNLGTFWGERMSIFRARHFQFGLLLAVALSISPAAAQTYTPEQEQACTGDAFRLCSAISKVQRPAAIQTENVLLEKSTSAPPKTCPNLAELWVKVSRFASTGGPRATAQMSRRPGSNWSLKRQFSGVRIGTVGWARTTDLLFHRQAL